MEIIFSEGISKISEIIQLAEEYEILSKKGAWYYYENENIAQGKSNLKLLLQQKPELLDDIYNQVKKIMDNTD